MKHPFHQIHLYEIGSRLFCGKKGEHLPAIFNELEKKTPFVWADEIWLMGVWKNSPSSQRIAQTMPELQPGYQSVRSQLTNKDIYGSPYSIFEYNLDPLIGGDTDLTVIYEWSRSKNKKLILDFVPNHMAIDSPLVSQFPNLFLQSIHSEQDKNSFLHPNGNRYKHGKDPYFDGWTDTIQWDFSNPEVENYHIQILKTIAKHCDGVRCDMAMLPLPDVFERTHGKKSLYHWENVICSVKSEFPDFRFYAEVYWGLDGTLRSLGFDATYDKSLYDELVHHRLDQVAENISNESGQISKPNLIRFLENHDENRAKLTFGEHSKTYFSLLSCLPGILLLFDGQEIGCLKKIPVQMKNVDEESPDIEIEDFYKRAFAILSKRSKVLEYQTLNYTEMNQLPVFMRLLISDTQTELFLWNYQQVSCSGWIPYEEKISYRETLKDIVSNQIYPQGKPQKEGMYFKLEPNEIQWFIF
ncbi:alpha-amylase family protein [Leptospira levettii]|uniref:alpha-amylase family glycosyl hydrolase n=1 Tax=Leptospira levettii TaxID=2023178 RepID=UPI00223D5C53|nr:alpha-amylase family glycosyl hydrolase [Leptospira levettii]MCW7475385.1 alpha-amylase family glycosyl hydrolase [Leptospira levettii]